MTKYYFKVGENCCQMLGAMQAGKKLPNPWHVWQCLQLQRHDFLFPMLPTEFHMIQHLVLEEPSIEMYHLSKLGQISK